MKSLPIIGLVLVIGVATPARGYARDDSSELLDIVPLDLFRLEIRLPNHGENTVIANAPCSITIAVPHVVEGLHVPVPRTIDGDCPRRVSTEVVLEEVSQPVEFEPEGCMETLPSSCTHWIQHDVMIETSEAFDSQSCEVVIDLANAHDTVRRKILRHLTESEVEAVFGVLPPFDPLPTGGRADGVSPRAVED